MAVERIAGPGQPPTYKTRTEHLRSDYPWGELLYNERDWVAWVHGTPLLDRGKPVVDKGDSEADVVSALGPSANEFRHGRTIILKWPRYRLSVQFVDKKVYLCTLKSRYAQEHRRTETE
jgi:hypothetical protein